MSRHNITLRVLALFIAATAICGGLSYCQHYDLIGTKSSTDPERLNIAGRLLQEIADRHGVEFSDESIAMYQKRQALIEEIFSAPGFNGVSLQMETRGPEWVNAAEKEMGQYLMSGLADVTYLELDQWFLRGEKFDKYIALSKLPNPIGAARAPIMINVGAGIDANDAIRRLPAMTVPIRLNFMGPYANDSTMELLAERPTITELRLDSSPISDDGLMYLSQMPELQILSLDETRITNEAMSYIGQLLKLKQLSIWRTDINDSGIAMLGNRARLEELSIGPNFTDAGIATLQNFPNLKRLYIAKSQITDAGMARLGQFERLESIGISDTQVTDTGLSKIGHLRYLSELWLNGTDISDNGLRTIAGLPSLKKLCLGRTQITDAGMQILAKQSSLQELYLNGTSITDAGIETLAAMKTLKVLDVEKTQISDAGLQSLSRLYGLRRIRLSQTNTTEQGREALKQALTDEAQQRWFDVEYHEVTSNASARL